MIPVIWPWALRFIQTKNPMTSRIGKAYAKSEPRMLLEGEWNVRSTLWARMDLRSSAIGGWGPETLYLVPSVSSPVMWPLELSTTALRTWLASTRPIRSV